MSSPNLSASTTTRFVAICIEFTPASTHCGGAVTFAAPPSAGRAGGLDSERERMSLKDGLEARERESLGLLVKQTWVFA